MTSIEGLEKLESLVRKRARLEGHKLGPFRVDTHKRALAPTQRTYASRCLVCNVLVILNAAESWTAHNDRALSQVCRASMKQAPFFKRIE